ncbi:hypothetical protein GCM10010982_26190 [Bowmanella pacifica]|uniref:Uncharacterized protein n=1 Tax=Bowmanella pacifica TaxID=502051 RepID=A0A917Z049_9ALTE|nr:hypothetical protein GCM10010982_26190 [Bowmanella pacifica]
MYLANDTVLNKKMNEFPRIVPEKCRETKPTTRQHCPATTLSQIGDDQKTITNKT